LNMDRALFFRTRLFTNLMSQWDFYCESRSTSVHHCRLRLTFPRHVLKRLTNFLRIQLFFDLFYGWGPSVKTLGSHGGVGCSKIILDFCPVICLVRGIMDRLGKVGREVVKKLDYQW
jgi:hypothetical protein